MNDLEATAMNTYLESSHPASECRHCVLARLCGPAGRPYAGVQYLKLRQGDRLPTQPARYVYVLLRGGLRICRGGGPGDRSILLARVIPGEVIGLEAVEEKQYSGEITAEEPSEVCRVPIAYIRESLEQSPGLGFYLARLLGSRLARPSYTEQKAPSIRYLGGGD